MLVFSSIQESGYTVLYKSNTNTCQQNSTKFLAFRRILDRNKTSTTFLQIFEACIVLNGSNFRQHIPWWHSCDSKFQVKICSMQRIIRAIIHCNCSFFQKDLAEFVVRYCSRLLGFTTRIIWKLCLTSFMVNLPRLGRPQKLSMEANSVCRNCAK